MSGDLGGYGCPLVSKSVSRSIKCTNPFLLRSNKGTSCNTPSGIVEEENVGQTNSLKESQSNI